ncbi:MAG: IS110 family transposase, partial [Paraprevotella sp.]|nr:IS110 family transposase [Paraprevotella sp.]
DLSQAANSAIVWDKEIKEYYERKRKEGKAYGVVLNAVKFKLICRMFVVVRRGTPFVPLQTYKS